jgi:tRNA A-37 threonylcarbamoyl transferase component Bud32
VSSHSTRINGDASICYFSCDSIAILHKLDYVHGDIKVGNILFSCTNAEAYLIDLDFTGSPALGAISEKPSDHCIAEGGFHKDAPSLEEESLAVCQSWQQLLLHC